MIDGLAGAAGATLKGVFGSVARLRPAAKPLHPQGVLLPAIIERRGMMPAVGVPWIDGAGTDRVTVRFSRAIGLPSGWPDIHGLAIRVPVGDHDHGDVLLATTGRSALGRFALVPGRAPTAGIYSTLLPYRTATGPLLLSALPDGERRLTLACAHPLGQWHDFGHLELVSGRMSDADTAGNVGPSFDPVLNQIPGLAYYPWAAKLREGSYRAARRSRREKT